MGTDICEAYLEKCPGNSFFDLRHNLQPHHAAGKYSTHLFQQHAQHIIEGHSQNHSSEPLFLYLAHQACHFPAQAPNSTIAGFRTTMLEGFEMRQSFVGCAAELDDSVGELVESLTVTGLF